MITPQDACAVLGVTPAELHLLIADGQLAGDSSGHVTEQAIEEYIALRLPATRHGLNEIKAAGEAAAAALPPLTQDQADMAAAILQAHQDKQPDDPAA